MLQPVDVVPPALFAEDDVVGADDADEAIDVGRHLVDGAVGFEDADRALGRRLRIAFVSATEEAATIAERTVGDTYVARVVVTAGDSEQRDEENPEAFHGKFDAGARGLFICREHLKTEQFR